MADQVRHTQKRIVAHGVPKNGRLRVVCEFDAETFAAIRKRAIREHTSFGEQIRTLVEWGLEDAAQEAQG